MSWKWSACFDTGGRTFICNERVPGYPLLAGIDIATSDSQFPAGCTGTNQEDEIRIYCCKLDQ